MKQKDNRVTIANLNEPHENQLGKEKQGSKTNLREKERTLELVRTSGS